MAQRSLLSDLFNGYNAIKEYQAVEKYKEQSDIYKKAMVAVHATGVHPSGIEQMNNLNKATSFANMIEIAKEMDPDGQPPIVQALAKTIAYFGARINAEANFRYYAFQLRKDILTYAVEKGFYNNLESKETAMTYRS